MTPHTQNNTSSRHTGEKEPRGPGHCTRNTTNRAGTLVNRSKLPSTRHKQSKGRSGRTG